MAWARLDDAFWSHPKVIAAGNEATGLHVRAMSYVAGHGTAGTLSVETVKMMAGSRWKALSTRCVQAGLWDTSDGGWEIHDWDDPAYGNPTSPRGKARSEAARKAAQARWGPPPDDANRMPDACEPHSEPDAECNADPMRADASRRRAPATPSPNPVPKRSPGSVQDPPELSNARTTSTGGSNPPVADPIRQARKRAAGPHSPPNVEGWDVDHCGDAMRKAAAQHDADLDEAYDRLLVIAASSESRSPYRLVEPGAWNWAGSQLADIRRGEARRRVDAERNAATAAEHAATEAAARDRRQRIEKLAEADPDGWAAAQLEARSELEAEGITPLGPIVAARALDIAERASA